MKRVGITEIAWLIIIALIIWRISVKKNKKRLEVQQQEAEKKEQQREKENENNQKLKQQKDLIDRFISSDTTREMLLVICNGDPQQNLPREIVIRDNSITGYHADGVCTFDFASNRVNSFYPVGGVALDRDEFKYLVRPQVAMAEALNKLLSNQYAISDNASVETNRHTDCDGDPYYIYTYNSSSVKMVLKNTLPDRSTPSNESKTH